MRYYLAVFITIFLFFILFFGFAAEYFHIHYDTVIFVLRTAFVVFAVFTIIVYLKRRNGEVFGQIDRSFFLIALEFLKLKKTDDFKKFDILKTTFNSYSEKHIQKLFEKYKSSEIDISYPCSNLSRQETKLKIYTLYILFNLASYDKTLKKEEEDFIVKVTKLLRLPKQTYFSIKSIYVKKGLNDEEELKKEQNRKQNISGFLFPYEAYRILGVSPSVTKLQLKKAYRTLAKKYHPDKHIGKSEAEIQKIEEKFQEIKEAYDIILKQFEK
jgi:DnaJ like chaperone protein